MALSLRGALFGLLTIGLVPGNSVISRAQETPNPAVQLAQESKPAKEQAAEENSDTPTAKADPPENEVPKKTNPTPSVS